MIDRLLADIDKLAGLYEDWDSYGAGPIAPGAIERAKALVRQSSEQAIGLPIASGPTADGGVVLRWKNGAPELDVVITADTARYAILSGRKLIAHGPLTDVGLIFGWKGAGTLGRA